MHPNLFPISCIFIAIVTLIHLPASLAQGNEFYQNCSYLLVQRGNIQGIRYPFWGANRPQSCGHQSFFLNGAEEAPVLTIQTWPYRVPAMDNTNAVRQEYWNNICPQYLCKATLDATHFSYANDTDDLRLSYTPSIKSPKQFSDLIQVMDRSDLFKPRIITIDDWMLRSTWQGLDNYSDLDNLDLSEPPRIGTMDDWMPLSTRQGPDQYLDLIQAMDGLMPRSRYKYSDLDDSNLTKLCSMTMDDRMRYSTRRRGAQQGPDIKRARTRQQELHFRISRERLAFQGSTSSVNVTQVLDSCVWQASNSNCEQCVLSRGLCAPNSSNPGSCICFCSDRGYAVSCVSSPGDDQEEGEKADEHVDDGEHAVNGGGRVEVGEVVTGGRSGAGKPHFWYSLSLSLSLYLSNPIGDGSDDAPVNPIYRVVRCVGSDLVRSSVASIIPTQLESTK